MSKSQNTLFPISIIVGAIIVSAGLFFGLSAQQSAIVKDAPANIVKTDTVEKEDDTTLNPLLALTEEDHIFGNPDAPISLIEYSDFECPFCKRFHLTPELLVDEFEDEVNWVYRHYPLSFHDPAATLEASATECANEQGGNDSFWKYSELIFDTTLGNGNGIEKDQLIAMAGELDLDESDFEECLDSNKYQDHIKQDFKNGSILGVSGTPATFVVNHETGKQQLVSGAQSFEAIELIIQRMQ